LISLMLSRCTILDNIDVVEVFYTG
jgi:hypothetical protein